TPPSALSGLVVQTFLRWFRCKQMTRKNRTKQQDCKEPSRHGASKPLTADQPQSAPMKAQNNKTIIMTPRKREGDTEAPPYPHHH
ncbi:hypothetical protein, partial [Xanthomonas phaseoli]|uniref:hypothetical protein n=1 Tax=Xanthomonas phaseoli TaxID=1985254 RepID=UPI001ED90176